MRLRELLIGGGLVCALLLGMAAIANRCFTQPAPLPDPLATPTPQATPTGGWWETVALATPALPALPGVGTAGFAAGGQGATTDMPFNVIACPHPTVKIAQITAAKRDWWTISGTAQLASFAYYKTELSTDGQGWTLLYRSATPVVDDTLMEFNIRTVPRGTYQLRLVVVDRTGNYPDPCTIQIAPR